MNTHTIEDVKPNAIVPFGSAAPEPLFIIKSDKLYLHNDLLDGLSEFFPPTTDYTICGEKVSSNWGKDSVLHRCYRCCPLPSLARESNVAIEDAKWLAGIFLGELRKNNKKYITIITVRDRDFEILKNEDNPNISIIKIVHQACVPKINTYEVMTTSRMKYRLNRDGYRVCYECEEEKELNSQNFYPDSSKAKGFQHICVKCARRKRHAKYHNAKIEDVNI